MKIYVSDNIYEYLTIGKRDIHSGVDDDLVVKSLEQHDKDLLKEFAKKIIKELSDKMFFETEMKDVRNIVKEILEERGME